MKVKDLLAPFVALFILIGFVVLVGVMLCLRNTSDQTWVRAVYIYGSVESLAFAAAGFFFGREIHREQAVKAEQRADANQKEAHAARSVADTEKAKGKALVAAIKSKATAGFAAHSEGTKVQRIVGVEHLISPVDELAAFADRLYPDSE